MRVLIIGGESFIGPPAVLRLRELGHEVALFNRGLRKRVPAIEIPAEVRRFRGDRKNLREHAGELRAFEPDVVLDMVAMTQADGEGLTEAFRGAAKRLVVLSSMDVYHSFGLLLGTEAGDPPAGPEDEDAPLRRNLFPYKDSPLKADEYDKILVERAVMAEPEALPATVLRLGMIYGPGDYQHRTKAYLDLMDAGEETIEIGQTQANWITARGYVGNVAEAIAQAVVDPRAANRIYNVVDAPNLPEIEWVRAIGQAAGWAGEAVAIPDDQVPEEERGGANFSIHLDKSAERIRRELDLPAPIPLAEALRETVAWERSLPKEA